MATSAALPRPIPFSKPDARNDFASTREDKPVTIDLLDNDKGPTIGIWKINGEEVYPGDSVELDSGACVTLGKDGKVVYDPSGSEKFDALDLGDIGSDTFRYTISDVEGGSDTATVRVKVKGVNDAPVAHDDVVYVPVKPIPYPLPRPLPVEAADAKPGNDGPIVTTLAIGEEGDPDPLPKSVKISPLDNDTDAEGDPLTIAKINGRDVAPGGSVKLKSGATVTLSKDGETLTYKGGILGHDGPGKSNGADLTIAPGPKFPYFADTFTYRASDGDALSDPAQITLVQTQIYYADDLV